MQKLIMHQRQNVKPQEWEFCGCGRSVVFVVVVVFYFTDLIQCPKDKDIQTYFSNKTCDEFALESICKILYQ